MILYDGIRVTAMTDQSDSPSPRTFITITPDFLYTFSFLFSLVWSSVPLIKAMQLSCPALLLEIFDVKFVRMAEEIPLRPLHSVFLESGTWYFSKMEASVMHLLCLSYIKLPTTVKSKSCTRALHQRNLPLLLNFAKTNCDFITYCAARIVLYHLL